MESLAVLLVTYNTRDLTLAALRSVQESDGPDREVVVVDNGSTDGTEAAVLVVVMAEDGLFFFWLDLGLLLVSLLWLITSPSWELSDSSS